MNPYTIQMPNFAGNFINAFGAGQGIAEMRNKQMAEQQQAQANAQFEQGFAQVAQTRDISKIWDYVAQNPSQYSEKMQKLVDSLDEQSLRRKRTNTAKELSYMRGESVDVKGLEEHLMQQRELLRDSNLPLEQKAKEMQEIDFKMESIQRDPEAYKYLANEGMKRLYTPEQLEKLATAADKTSTSKERDALVGGKVTEKDLANQAKEFEIGKQEETYTTNKEAKQAETKLKVQQAALAKAQAEGKPKEIALAEDQLAFSKLELAATKRAAKAEMMDFDDKDTAKDFVATQMAIEENNKAQVIATNLAAKVGVQDFGGSPTLWVEGFEKFWDGVSEEDRDVLRMELRQMGMLTAFSLKQAGSMSDQEKNDYLSTVPEKGASSTVWSKWLAENRKKSQQAYGALAIKRAFYDKNKTMLKAKDDMTLDVGGKPLEVKKGQYIRDIIRREGVRTSEFAPVIGSATKDLGGNTLEKKKEQKKASYLDSFKDAASYVDSLFK